MNPISSSDYVTKLPVTKVMTEESAEELNEMGNAFYFGNKKVKKDSLEAFKYCLLSAEKGCLKAAVNLARMYLSPPLGVEKNEQEALKWLQIAAEQKNEDAQNLLGSLYMTHPIMFNYPEAGRLYREIIENLHVSFEDKNVAFCHLAFLHLYGLGVPQSFEKGIDYFTKASTFIDKKGVVLNQGCPLSLISKSVIQSIMSDNLLLTAVCRSEDVSYNL